MRAFLVLLQLTVPAAVQAQQRAMPPRDTSAPAESAGLQVTRPDGWMARSGRHEGRDVTDAVFELKSREHVPAVEIPITDRVTVARGLVADHGNAPVGEGTVLLFPVDAEPCT